VIDTLHVSFEMTAVRFREVRQVGARRKLLRQMEDGDEDVREGVMFQEAGIFQEAQEKLPVPDKEFLQAAEIRSANVHGVSPLPEFPARLRKFLCRPGSLDQEVLPDPIDLRVEARERFQQEKAHLAEEGADHHVEFFQKNPLFAKLQQFVQDKRDQENFDEDECDVPHQKDEDVVGIPEEEPVDIVQQR